MRKLILILFIFVCVGCATMPTKLSQPKFNLGDKVIHNNRKAHIHAIYRGSNDTDYYYTYILVYEDVWKYSLEQIKESEIIKKD